MKLLLLALAACGSRQPKMIEHVESDPAWAKTYETRAAASSINAYDVSPASASRSSGSMMKSNRTREL